MIYKELKENIIPLKELITIKEDLSNQLEAYINKEFILSKLLKRKRYCL